MTDAPIPEGPWRTGRSWGRTIVIQRGPEPGSHGQDFLIGYAKGSDSKRHAQIACDAVNGQSVNVGARWHAIGCLVYDKPPDDLVIDWILAVDSEDLAARITDAVNGQVSDT